MKSTTQIIRARRRRGLRPGKSHWSVRLSLLILSLVVVLSGAAGVLTAYALAESSVTLSTRESLEISFMQSGRETHVPVRFFDRNQTNLLFEALNPEAQSRRWYQIDPAGPIVLPEHVIQASVSAQPGDYWNENPRPLMEILRALSLIRESSSTEVGQVGIVELLAEAQVLPLIRHAEDDPTAQALQRAFVEAELLNRNSRVELLEFFINTADYGNLAYGIDAAALVYFGKHATSLSLAESAMLAPIPFDPESNPLDAPVSARENQRNLLNAMRTSGMISSTEARRALNEELVFASGTESELSSLAAYLLDRYVDQFGRAALGRTGLQVRTTIDADLQHESECVLTVHLARLNQEDQAPATAPDCLASDLLPPLRPGDTNIDHAVDSGALVVMDAEKGEVLSLVGEAQMERPMAALGQPFIYLTAFAEGYSPGSMVMDLPVALDEPSGLSGLDLERFHGPVRIRTALANGYRAAAEKMVELVGVESVLNIFETMGVQVSREGEPGPESWQATLLDLVHASSVFANQGVLTGIAAGQGDGPVETIAILDIVDDAGQLVYAAQPVRKAVLSEQLAFLVNDVLSDELERRERLGPSNPLELNRMAAASATVSEGGRDAWALGYTPDRVAGVWLGSPSGLAPIDLTIRNSAAPVWHALMIYATRDLPPETWPLPAGVSRLEVCDPSGLLPTIYCPETVRELFISGTEPTTFDNLFQPYLVNKETGKLATLSTPVELVEERVYLVPPPEALAWTDAVGIDQPPQEYDTLTTSGSEDPDVRISSPPPFEFLRGIVRVRGYVNIDDLDFYRLQVGKGLNPLNWVQLGEDRSLPVRGGILAEWDTSELSGLYTLQLIAVQSEGQVRNALVHVTVDNEPPTGEVVFPAEGQLFTGTINDELAVQVDVQDDFGLDRVVFIIDGDEAAELRAEPFSFRWPMRSSGSHSVYAVAYDLAGNSFETPTVDFEIARP